MRNRVLFPAALVLLLLAALAIHLFVGRNAPPAAEVMAALLNGEAESYDQSVVLFQRLPRALMAIYAGAMTAAAGCVLQGLVRNPLASPSTLGINSGATLAVIFGVFLLDIRIETQGLAALAGACGGFLACLAVARLAGRRNDPRGLSLILSGALVSMLLVGATNALLLSDPMRRAEFLGWVSGNINHVYIDRLSAFWWIGALCLLTLGMLSRALTLILLGREKALSAGVNVTAVSMASLTAAVLGAGSAVAICGPIGFIGLVVPHLVRPLAGANISLALPCCILSGAVLCLFADLGARELFHPYVLHTGLVLDLLGGLAFAIIVKRFYLSPDMREQL
ncbi:ABC transporter permease [Metarhizobium album]|uniref:ABC transporter permease n=1 Tax=Metarhizobium album TaxID=2182425 RepID=A0A2U2DNP9_9HYPH|nr:iron ABC transporter permease [Rhizobium album]PWE54937.1 ABC transporter permease [Rhizobium album]